ncbi:MAG: DNA mismatch repair protein MutS [Spirochaetes bacterium GWF1_31_7]|nr:MAG: DNA mismatch repair protein MutS [Spirochaetes bacterium GWE1_32_154]OHD51032.1 MAG: DNA mismatch repair protein MutS [Spirochaetes bacterium GWF1_31_7]OHD77713.1 MAG: DNA mismatch repair protein MutS [Spirochaetes bacterium RIFOXYB1_FULL_32_8]HBI37897.1 DNA mismatch repair protein MutS [Spirochaetia bacterium]
MSNGYDTPMMKQHSEIKQKYPDAFLFFRCGDFYELFGNDAVEAVKILNIALTKRQNEIPMCGVPYHAADTYINRMIKAGKKVAICEQMEDPKSVKGIVKRAVTEIITPGTVLEEKHLLNKQNNYLLSLNIKGLWCEVSYIDISTGDFEVTEVEFTRDLNVLKALLFKVRPKEIIIPENIWEENAKLRELIAENENVLINRYPEWFFNKEETTAIVLKHFKISSYKAMGIGGEKTDITTPGALIRYLNDNFRGDLSHVRRLRYNNNIGTMELDESTIKNLELLRNQNDGTIVNSLLEVLDRTKTSMGARLLKKWIVTPLTDIEVITKRLDTVEFFYREQFILEKTNRSVKNIIDLERLASRLVTDKAGPKDLIGVKNSLEECLILKELLNNIPVLHDLVSKINPLEDVVSLINEAIKDEPATFIDEGNIVRDGYSEELSTLKDIATKGKEYIAEMEKNIKEKIAVPSLKIKYNKIIGYHFEVSKLQSVQLDSSFIIRQSLVNACRYTNKELSEFESKILTARDSINEMEKEIYYTVRNKVVECLDAIQMNADIISRLDIFTSFAEVAADYKYTRPLLNDGYELSIEEGRHPVVETKLDYNEFIPNDTAINANDFIMIITGPNMAGKSTYLRQNAIIVLMAQIGCFVPAKQAVIGVIDRIFTRIGSSDNLSRGESTFFVEMAETAYILNNATSKSLIIMDEIGRGTSTHDGLAIAWAILEYIRDKRNIGAKTLFATHYHELTELEKKGGFKNYSVAVSEKNDGFVFLHKIIDRPAERSYGVYVAQLAGIPDDVVQYAEKILENLQDSVKTDDVKVNLSFEQDLFGFTEEKKAVNKHKEIVDILKFLDLDRLTPLQALTVLYDLKKKSN